MGVLFTCMSAHNVHAVPVEASRGRYRWLLAIMWMLGFKPEKNREYSLLMRQLSNPNCVCVRAHTHACVQTFLYSLHVGYPYNQDSW